MKNVGPPPFSSFLLRMSIEQTPTKAPLAIDFIKKKTNRTATRSFSHRPNAKCKSHLDHFHLLNSVFNHPLHLNKGPHWCSAVTVHCKQPFCGVSAKWTIGRHLDLPSSFAHLMIWRCDWNAESKEATQTHKRERCYHWASSLNCGTSGPPPSAGASARLIIGRFVFRPVNNDSLQLIW